MRCCRCADTAAAFPQVLESTQQSWELASVVAKVLLPSVWRNEKLARHGEGLLGFREAAWNCPAVAVRGVRAELASDAIAS